MGLALVGWMDRLASAKKAAQWHWPSGNTPLRSLGRVQSSRRCAINEIHGGATWDGKVNVTSCVIALVFWSKLVPVIIG